MEALLLISVLLVFYFVKPVATFTYSKFLKYAERSPLMQTQDLWITDWHLVDPGSGLSPNTWVSAGPGEYGSEKSGCNTLPLLQTLVFLSRRVQLKVSAKGGLKET